MCLIKNGGRHMIITETICESGCLMSLVANGIKLHGKKQLIG